MSNLKEFGVYLLTQEKLRQAANTGVEFLTYEQIAELHANAFENPVPHTLTEEDFTNNPDLAEVKDENGEALKPGDVIDIPSDPTLSVDENGELK